MKEGLYIDLLTATHTNLSKMELSPPSKGNWADEAETPDFHTQCKQTKRAAEEEADVAEQPAKQPRVEPSTERYEARKNKGGLEEPPAAAAAAQPSKADDAPASAAAGKAPEDSNSKLKTKRVALCVGYIGSAYQGLQLYVAQQRPTGAKLAPRNVFPLPPSCSFFLALRS
mgnify:CR=1 FL=1